MEDFLSSALAQLPGLGAGTTVLIFFIKSKFKTQDSRLKSHDEKIDNLSESFHAHVLSTERRVSYLEGIRNGGIES